MCIAVSASLRKKILTLSLFKVVTDSHIMAVRLLEKISTLSVSFGRGSLSLLSSRLKTVGVNLN